MRAGLCMCVAAAFRGLSACLMPASHGTAPLADVPDCHRRDGPPQLVIRRKHPVIAMPVLPRRRDKVRQSIPIQRRKTAAMNVADETKAHVVRDVIRIDQERVRRHVDDVVRSTVEETLNGLLEQEISIGTSKPATQRHQSP